MFTLRTIFQNEIERNNFLGENFELVKKETCKQEFQKYFDETFTEPSENDKQEVYAFVNTPEILIPLYKVHSYYIMTDEGKTFSRIKQ